MVDKWAIYIIKYLCILIVISLITFLQTDELVSSVQK